MSQNQKIQHHNGEPCHDPYEIILDPVSPYKFLSRLIKFLRILRYFSRPLLRSLQTFFPGLQHVHIFFHNFMYILQLLLHPIHIFYRIGIFKLLLLALYAPIEFNEVVVATDRLHPRLEVGRPQQTFSLIKKRVDQSIYKTIGEFQRVGFVNNYGKNYIATHLIENAVAGMLYLLERSMILFVIGGDFRVILLDLVPDLQQLLVHVAFARLAKEEPVGEST